MRRALLLLFASLPLFAQLPEGVSRVTFRNDFYAWNLVVTAGDTLWVTPFINRAMARVDVHGVARDVDLPAGRNAGGFGAGPDGALWFGSNGFIARVDPLTNVIESWPLGAGHTPYHILAGPDGNLWFVETQGRVVCMRPDGEILRTYEAGGFANGAGFGSDGALHLAMATKVVRITIDGERSEHPTTAIEAGFTGFAGSDFFWHGGRALNEPERAPNGAIMKTSFTGETLATYSIAMTPLAADERGNLWLRALTDEGVVLGKLSPTGVLTRFGPLPPLPATACHQWWYAGMDFLSDGRVAMADHYADIPRTGTNPCLGARRPADLNNTITIVDPRLLPVLSVEVLNRTPRRRGARQ
ncbi:MAG TPA: hypothetical protein VF266_26175 [Thermoanaerobaculia bacterium]